MDNEMIKHELAELKARVRELEHDTAIALTIINSLAAGHTETAQQMITNVIDHKVSERKK